MTADPAQKARSAFVALWVVRLSTFAAWGGGLATLLMVAVTLADVVGRSVFNHSMRGVYEMTQVLLVPAVFAGLGEATRRNAQVVVDLIDVVLTSRTVAILARIADAATLLVIGVLVWMGVNEARQAARFGDVTADLRLSVLWLWVPLLTGLAICGAVVALRLVTGNRR